MPAGTPYMVSVVRTRRVEITLPQSDADIKTINDYIVDQISDADVLQDLGRCCGFKILGKIPAGTDRGALLVGDATDDLPQYVAAGADFSEPADTDIRKVFVVAASASADEDVVVVLYIG